MPSDQTEVKSSALLACSTFCAVGRPQAETVRRLIDLGFRGIEIFADLPPDGGVTIPETDAADLFALGEQHRLRFSLHAPIAGCDPAAASAEARAYCAEQYRAAGRLARRLGADLVVVHSGWRPASATPEEARDNALATLRPVIEEAARLGVTFVVENTGWGSGQFFQTPADHAALVDAPGSPFARASVDVGHARCQGWEPAAHVRALGRRLAHVHLQDGRAGFDDHRPLGAGELDLPAVFAALAAIGFRGRLVLEIGPHADLEQLRTSRDLARRLARGVGLALVDGGGKT